MAAALRHTRPAGPAVIRWNPCRGARGTERDRERDPVWAWATGLAESAPVGAGLVLGVVALLKVAGAVVPVLVERGRLGGRLIWRRLVWAGGVVLMLYGIATTAVAWAVLLGVVSTAAGYDARAQLGHAALWNPLFALWGALLLVGLRRSRTPNGAGTAAHRGRR